MNKKKTAIYALTAQGAELGRSLSMSLESELYVFSRYSSGNAIPFQHLSTLLQNNFHKFDSHVFISACGIAVRAVAPLLVSKLSDPAVVVLDQSGKFAISLVSGHLGGANNLAVKISEIIGAQAVITTATDACGLPSIDLLAEKCGLAVLNPEAFKHINAAILDGLEVELFDPHNLLSVPPGLLIKEIDSIDSFSGERAGICVGAGNSGLHKRVLRLHPKALYLGIGCRKGADVSDIMSLLEDVFKAEHLSLKAVACVASIDIKKDEPGILAAAKLLNAQTIFYSSDELQGIEVSLPSEFVRQTVGVPGVCEAAALKSSEGRLIICKRKNLKATMAVAVKC